MNRSIRVAFNCLFLLPKVVAFRHFSNSFPSHSRLLSTMTDNTKPFREVICADSLQWLNNLPPEGLPKDCSVFTSLPDIGELPDVYHGFLVKEYKEWFTDTISLVMSKLQVGSYIIFLQSDARMMNTQREVYEWIDKSHLASVAADRNNCTLLWHKLVLCNTNLNYRSTGRPTYSHLVCYVKNPAIRSPIDCGEGLDAACKDMISHRTSHFAIPDIFYRGEMLWPKGIGLDCCYAGIMFLKEIAKATVVFDPFCGQGTTLAMANAVGLNARGIEISPKRCRKASKLKITSKHLDLICPAIRTIKLNIVDERSELKSKSEAEKKEQEDREKNANQIDNLRSEHSGDEPGLKENEEEEEEDDTVEGSAPITKTGEISSETNNNNSS